MIKGNIYISLENTRVEDVTIEINSIVWGKIRKMGGIQKKLSNGERTAVTITEKA